VSAGEGAFATKEELASAWRPLSDTEAVWADQLLAAAATRIRDRWREAFGTEIDESHPGARTISIAVVKEVLDAEDRGMLNFKSFKTVVGDWEEGGSLVNPGGTLEFTDWHWSLLGIRTKALPQYHFQDNDY
jgi:hypothetical protein